MFNVPNLAKNIGFIIKICTISSHHPSRNQQQQIGYLNTLFKHEIVDILQ